MCCFEFLSSVTSWLSVSKLLLVPLPPPPLFSIDAEVVRTTHAYGYLSQSYGFKGEGLMIFINDTWMFNEELLMMRKDQDQIHGHKSRVRLGRGKYEIRQRRIQGKKHKGRAPALLLFSCRRGSDTTKEISNQATDRHTYGRNDRQTKRVRESCEVVNRTKKMK